MISNENGPAWAECFLCAFHSKPETEIASPKSFCLYNHKGTDFSHWVNLSENVPNIPMRRTEPPKVIQI